MNNSSRLGAIFVMALVFYVSSIVAGYYSISSDDYTPYYVFYSMLLCFYLVLPTGHDKIEFSKSLSKPAPA